VGKTWSIGVVGTYHPVTVVPRVRFSHGPQKNYQYVLLTL